MNFNELMANSNTAFGSGEFDTALKYAKAAIKEEPKKTEPYYAAGKACMSLDKLEDAIKYFKTALEIDNKNGNGYFLLGYANAMAENLTDALRAMTRAIENNCDDELKGQVYRIMAMINTDQADFENAILNITQAEEFTGPVYELLQQKAACYAAIKDNKEALYTLNQMKLLQPKNYTAYSLAFQIFMTLKIYDEAEAELDRAGKYAELNMDYYNDRVAFAMLKDINDLTSEAANKIIFDTINAIDTALKKGKPTAEQAFDSYLRAAQLYINLDKPDMSLKCLEASEDTVSSFNNGFSVLENTENNTDGISIDFGMSAEDEEELMQEKWDNGEFEELSEKIEEILDEIGDDDPDETAQAVQKYLTPLNKVPSAEKDESVPYLITDAFELNETQKDLQASLYMSAYETKKDYDNMLRKARELQNSKNTATRYSGIYSELKIGKYRNDENWEKKYRDRINFWMKKMLEDPNDYFSAAYRVRCYIDLGDYENAEQICSCLPAEMKETLMEELEKAKAE